MLVEEVYAASKLFPADERFGLISHVPIQLRIDRIGRMLNGLIASLQPQDD